MIPDAKLVVPCPVEPRLGDLDTDLRERVRYDASAGALTVAGLPDALEIHALRGCHDGPTWQVVVDRLAEQVEVTRASHASHFPPTQWGLLLKQLGTGEDGPWRRFLDLYRRPAGLAISRVLARVGRRTFRPAEELADEFFGWFFERRVFDRLRRVGDDGRVFRFRGYLKRCIVTFLKERTGRETVVDARELEGLVDRASSADAAEEVARAVDGALARDAIDGELDALREEDPGTWKAVLFDVRGLTLQQVTDRLAEGSVATAHRRRKRAREVLRDRLVERRLSAGVLSEEDALLEYRELLPELATALKAYADRVAHLLPGG